MIKELFIAIFASFDVIVENGKWKFSFASTHWSPYIWKLRITRPIKTRIFCQAMENIWEHEAAYRITLVLQDKGPLNVFVWELLQVKISLVDD